jgi:hypothetical protein
LDSKCFELDYDDLTQPDPAGCRVFKKSFKPLQELRACIVDKLDADPIWSNRNDWQISDGDFQGPWPEWCQQAKFARVNLGVTSFGVKFCKHYMTSKQRAQEMIKMVLFEDIPDSVPEAVALVERKVCSTVSWPRERSGQAPPPCLEPATRTAIRSQCFKVEEQRPLDETRFLHRIRPCLPVMFDKVEIMGLGLEDSMHKFQGKRYGKDFKRVYEPRSRSVCGRLALAAIPRFQTTKYIFTRLSGIPEGVLGTDVEPTWAECLDVQETNCRKFYFCWERALRRMCKFSQHCCPYPDSLETHIACTRSPNHGDCPKALNTHSGSKSTLEHITGSLSNQMTWTMSLGGLRR